MRLIRILPFSFFLLIGSFLFASNISQEEAIRDRQIEVSIRMVGHQLLLNQGDSLSRVLPIQKEGDVYYLSFESPFAFKSNELINTIDEVMQASEHINHYIVEVEDDLSKEIIYNYEVRDSLDFTKIPCGLRSQPIAKYNIILTIVSDTGSFDMLQTYTSELMNQELGNNPLIKVLVILLFLILLGISYYRFKNRPVDKIDLNILNIGKYRFNYRNMELEFNNNRVELTNKESELLHLLHNSSNTTLERQTILEKVWGDEGAYIGRTLDVFISKLRKKLEGDPDVKIVNIRGVGYKLVLNN